MGQRAREGNNIHGWTWSPQVIPAPYKAMEVTILHMYMCIVCIEACVAHIWRGRVCGCGLHTRRTVARARGGGARAFTVEGGLHTLREGGKVCVCVCVCERERV